MNSAMFDYEMGIENSYDGLPENETMTAFESSVGADEKQSSVTLSKNH